MTARLWNPTGRRTQAHVVEIGAHAFYFSYATCIAYAGPLGRARRANVWSRTTARHFRELGCGGFPVVEPDELDALVLRAVASEMAGASRGRRASVSGRHALWIRSPETPDPMIWQAGTIRRTRDAT